MRIPSRAALVAISASATLGLASIAPAGADDVVLSTAYYLPTQSVMYYPTRYVRPTAYTYTSAVFEPTYYLSPTAYYSPVAYYSPSYVATEYRLPRRWYRPYRATSRTYYYDVTPTAYYAPTTYDVSVVRATSVACDTTPTSNAQAPVETAAKKSDPASAKTPPSVVDSQVRGKSDPQTSPAAAGGAGGGARDFGKVGEPELFPDKPAPDKKDDMPVGPDVDSPPNLPAGGKPADGVDRRESLRPAPTALKPVAAAPSRSILRGEVIAGEPGTPKKGVKVVFSDARQRFGDKAFTTGDDGLFEVFLPEGDWSIQVVDPAAKAGDAAKSYGNVTSSGGIFLDDKGQRVYSLKLSF